MVIALRRFGVSVDLMPKNKYAAYCLFQSIVANGPNITGPIIGATAWSRDFLSDFLLDRFLYCKKIK